jgi:hypothetical protein
MHKFQSCCAAQEPSATERQHLPPRSHACLPQPAGQTGSAGGAGPGDTDLPVADGLGPDCCVTSVKPATGYLLICGHV